MSGMPFLRASNKKEVKVDIGQKGYYRTLRKNLTPVTIVAKRTEGILTIFRVKVRTKRDKVYRKDDEFETTANWLTTKRTSA